MKVLSLPMGADTGGVTASIGRAFGNVRPPGWTFRSIISTVNYIEYPYDMLWSDADVRRYWRWADVVHLHESMVAAERLTKGWKGFRLPRRPMVVHYHGTGFRERPERYLAKQRRWGAVGLVATLDLWLLAPNHLTWMPCPVDVAMMRRIRLAQYRRHDGVTIAHAPTNRDVKSTDLLRAAVARLRDEGYNVALDLIEGVTWEECLLRKAQADIVFDQVLLGYGNNAIECWAMGIPVIAGAQPATLALMRRRFGQLPFYLATPATIYEAVRDLVLSGSLRTGYAVRGYAHVERWHAERPVIRHLMAAYARAT